MTEKAIKILVVDDDEMILTALGKLLERRGYDVTTASGPQLALDAFHRALADDAPFSVVLCDYRMPGMVGSEVLSQIGEASPETARLLITANTDFDTVQDAVNRGGIHRVIAKPWKPRELFETVAESARLASLQRENRELHDALQRQNEILRNMNEHLDRLVHQRTGDLLDGLISALDHRDTETQWHSRRVSLYARALAERLGIKDPLWTSIEQGALLHDIGKIGVRDQVLLKPGKLTAEEWEEMRGHVRHGYELLAPIDFLHDAATVVLHHHERYDGQGYPQGLCGEDITIGARIFAVVDTYDAITSDRPYRAGRPPEVACAEIGRCSGSQFDARIAEAFVSAPIETWLCIRDQVLSLAAQRSHMIGDLDICERKGQDSGPAVGLAS